MKQDAIDCVPENLLLPNIYSDFQQFDETYERYEIEIDIENDFVNNGDSIEHFWIKFYFVRMVTMLKTLNCMTDNNEIGNQIVTFGFELNTCGGNFYIFPDTEFNQQLVRNQQFP